MEMEGGMMNKCSECGRNTRNKVQCLLCDSPQPRITPEMAKRIAAEVVQSANGRLSPVAYQFVLSQTEIDRIAATVERVGNDNA